MPRPNIEILRAKLALMSPNECPSAAIAAARNNFPDALEILWIMPTTSVANSKSTRSSSVTIASIGGDGLTPMSDTGPQLPAPPTVARDAVAGLPAPTPSAINSRAVNENVNINAGLNSVFEVDMPDRSPTIQRNAENFVANNTQLNVPSFANNAQLNARAFVSNSQIIVKYPTVNEAQSKAEAEAIAAYRGGSGRLPQFIVNLCNSIKIPSHIARKRSKVSTRPLRNDSYYTDSYENGNKNGRANGGINSSTGNVKKDHASKSTPAGNQKGKNIQGSAKRLKKNSDQVDVIIISDDSDDEVEMINATKGFKPRYVVVDIVGWVFREVATANKAVRMCAQVMPPIHAGNGVRLYSEYPFPNVHSMGGFFFQTFPAPSSVEGFRLSPVDGGWNLLH